MRPATMKRIHFGVLVRTVLFALALVFAMGAGVYAGARSEPAGRSSGVDPLAEQELSKFAVTDLSQALARVAGEIRSDSAK